MSDLQPAKLLTFPHPHEAKPAACAKAFVSADPRSQQVLRQLERLAPTGATVLIVGETGTGKELAARYLHERSERPGPFVAINCGALSEHLVEAELFGHEAAAFTGAQHARAGWFETANGGTLFLDEIGDMPPALQVKLLRVLQERHVVRVGSRKLTPVNVRVVAATNLELEPALKAGRFRADLYHRLKVAAVNLPPLRERPGDVLPLAMQFFDLYKRELGLDDVALSEGAIQAILEYEWPGNIRELENAVHYGLIMCDGSSLEAADLRLTCDAPEGDRGRSSVAPEGDPDDAIATLRRGLCRLLHSDLQGIHQSVERLVVETVFDHCERNQVRTAARLGLSRNVVRAQLMRHGLLSKPDRMKASSSAMTCGPQQEST